MIAAVRIPEGDFADDGRDNVAALSALQQIADNGAIVVHGVPVTADRHATANVVASFLRKLGDIEPQDGTGSWYHVIVDDEEGRRQETAVAFPTSKNAFEFHSDAAFRPAAETVDIVALVCIAEAARGGDSYLLRAEAVIRPTFNTQIGALAGKPVHPLLREFVRCARACADQALAGAASSSASS